MFPAQIFVPGRRVFLIWFLVLTCLNCSFIGLRGEPNSRIELRNDQYPYHRVLAPAGYNMPGVQKLELGNQEVRVDLYSRSFAQGEVLYLEIAGKDGDPGNLTVHSVQFGTHPVVPVKRKWGYRALVPVPPEQETGKTQLTVSYNAGSGRNSVQSFVQIMKADFAFSVHPLDLGKYSNVDHKLSQETLEFIKQCVEKKRKAFSMNNPDNLDEVFSHPRNMHYVTSQFWSKRLYMRYRYKSRRKVRLPNQVSIHGGVDLRGKTGEPVYAIAGGKIALADKLYYEGNFVVIDHGNRIFSYYMHMNDLSVKEGTMIKAGDVIGHVGSTGISTASHLHVSLVIQGIQVDPLSLLSLPLKN